MRTPEEMFHLIEEVAKEDEKIWAVLLTGSRANKDCPKDRYQDFDVVYFVTDVKPYWDNMEWIKDKFGMPVVLQKPESMKLIAPDGDGKYVYLMLFADGNRIDLQITTEPYQDTGEPAILLLDKDGTFPKLNVREDYWYVKKPTQKEFTDCCNEFHWCLNNVAKGIAREELPYVMEQLNCYVRDMFHLMLSWYVGVLHDFKTATGKSGKYFRKLLPEPVYERFLKTYSDAAYEHIWEAAFEMLYLFGDVARQVAEKLDYVYEEDEEAGIEQYMKQVRNRTE